jgi:hypothetical protein
MANLTRDHFDASKWGVWLEIAVAGPRFIQFGGSADKTVFQMDRETWEEMGCPKSISIFIKREPIT